jgi:magnesium chelatase family protein
MPLRLPRGFSGKCRCAPERVARYRGKISGPLIDRIDIHIEVPAVPPEDLLRISSGESSAAVSARVTVARQRHQARRGKPNAELATKEVDRYCRTDAAGANLIKHAIAHLNSRTSWRMSSNRGSEIG